MDKVSIIIPFYNTEYIDEAIESALNQTYPNVEVIVVNDGSEQYNDKMKPYLNRIKYVEKPNGGTASALNAGIRAMTGDYFCWLSADDRFLPDKTEQQLNFMKERGAAAGYTAFVLINSEGKVTSDILGMTISDRIGFLRYMKRSCPINGCTIMLRKDLFEKVGLFDESLPYTHDYDMWLRIVQSDDFHYLPVPTVEYRVHHEMGSVKYRDDQMKETKKLQRKYRSALGKAISKEVRKKRMIRKKARMEMKSGDTTYEGKKQRRQRNKEKRG